MAAVFFLAIRRIRNRHQPGRFLSAMERTNGCDSRWHEETDGSFLGPICAFMYILGIIPARIGFAGPPDATEVAREISAGGVYARKGISGCSCASARFENLPDPSAGIHEGPAAYMRGRRSCVLYRCKACLWFRDARLFTS